MKVDWNNLLVAGDLHLRKTAPAMRIDDFFAAQDRKLSEIFSIAQETDCGAVVFPGDVFDRSDAPYGLVEYAIRKFQKNDLLYFFVYGQHDLRYHTSDKQNTPLGCLVAGLEGRAHILTPETGFRLTAAGTEAVFWGCSWGEPLPIKLVEDAINVVVMHRPITVDPLPWDHEDLLTADELTRLCSAQLFLTGDNHTRFTADYKTGQSVINLGSVMRTTTAQLNHKPAVALVHFDQGGFSYRLKNLTIRKGVFDEQALEEKKDHEERLAAFVQSLSGEFDPELSFIDNLRKAAVTAPGGVQSLIAEILQ